MSEEREILPGTNFEKTESNPQAPISQMAKLRLREAGCLAHANGARGADFPAGPSQPNLEPLWGGGSCAPIPSQLGWRMRLRRSSELSLEEPGSRGGARGAWEDKRVRGKERGRRGKKKLLQPVSRSRGNKHSFLASWALSLLIPPPLSPPPGADSGVNFISTLGRRPRSQARGSGCD